MGIYEHHKVGILFESKEPLSYIQSMLPRRAHVTSDAKSPNMYFVKCFEISCMETLKMPFSGLENQALRRLWQHLEQTKGFEPRKFTCITYESSTYSDRVYVTREQDFVIDE